MATVSLSGGLKNRLSPEAKQRAERLKATAAMYAADVDRDKAERAELLAQQRNGTLSVTLDKRPGVPEQVTCIEDIDVEVRPFRRREDFRSRADARPMNKAEIANVSILTRDDVAALTAEFQQAAPGLFKRTRAKIDAEWQGLLDDSERYALTAYAMRKLTRDKGAM